MIVARQAQVESGHGESSRSIGALLSRHSDYASSLTTGPHSLDSVVQAQLRHRHRPIVGVASWRRCNPGYVQMSATTQLVALTLTMAPWKKEDGGDGTL